MNTKHTATLFAILAAALYAINIPLSKLLLLKVEPTMMAAFLYLGAGLGLFLYGLIFKEKESSESLTRKELPYTIGMIVLDIFAPILLMLGLTQTNSANASLLNEKRVLHFKVKIHFETQYSIIINNDISSSSKLKTMQKIQLP